MGKIAAAGRAAKSLNSPALQRARRPNVEMGHGVSPQDRNSQLIANLEMSGNRVGDDPNPAAVSAFAREHVDDVQNNAIWPLAPRLGGRVGLASGGLEGANTFSRELFRALSESGATPIDLSRSAVGRSQSVVDPRMSVDTAAVPRDLSSDAQDPMGWAGGNVAVTRTTPLAALDQMTGSPAASDRVLTNIQSRSLPFGAGAAGIYHADNIAREATKPITVYTGLKNGFSQRDALGFFDPVSRAVFYNASADPRLSPKRIGKTNVAQHELIHSLLDSVPADQQWMISGLRPEIAQRLGVSPRAGMADVDWDAMRKTPAGRAAHARFGNWSELGNLMFHAKRLHETIDSGMRDLGGRAAGEEWWRLHVGEFEPTGSDPVIDLPGHTHEGEPAHGYEELMEYLQQIQNNAGPKADADHLDLLYKLGDNRPDIRKALMS